MAKGQRFTREQADQDLFYIGLHLRGYKKMKVCGSYRRELSTVGDLDIVVVPDGNGNGTGLLQYSINGLADEILASGEKLSHIVLPSGIQTDFYISSERLFEAHTLFLTGSKGFNIRSRAIAKKMGYRLSQYGLLNQDGEEVALSEEEILETLGLKDFIDPVTRSI